MVDLTTVKAAARQAAFARRKAAKGVADEGAALSHLADWLAQHRGRAIAEVTALQVWQPLNVYDVSTWATPATAGAP